MPRYEEDDDYAVGYGAFGSRPADSFGSTIQDSSGRAALNALLINQSTNLHDEYAASVPGHFMVPADHEAQIMGAGFHADILSASTYPNMLSGTNLVTRQHERRTKPATFGGYHVLDELEDADDLMARDNINTEKPAKKRTKRKSKSDEDDAGKKQRGRPRLDTQDETAADVCHGLGLQDCPADCFIATKDTDTPCTKGI